MVSISRIFDICRHHLKQHALCTGEFVEHIKRAVDLEIRYAKDVLPTGILGLNADMFVEYMQYIGNRRLEGVGIDFRLC